MSYLGDLFNEYFWVVFYVRNWVVLEGYNEEIE